MGLRGCGSVQRDGGALDAPRKSRCGFTRGQTLPAELLRVDAQSPQAEVLRYAAHFLTRGCVVGIPTDTFYGLAADPFNLAAVDEIYRVKGRPETRALPILVSSLEQAMLLARERPQHFLRLAEAYWPGALTLVVDASNRLPLKVTGGTGRVALRWARSEVVMQLIAEFEGPITGTSANVSGFPSCTSAEQVIRQLGARVPLVLDAGDTGAALPSTIIELRGELWKVLREGVIPVSEIEKTLQ